MRDCGFVWGCAIGFFAIRVSTSNNSTMACTTSNPSSLLFSSLVVERETLVGPDHVTSKNNNTAGRVGH